MLFRNYCQAKSEWPPSITEIVNCWIEQIDYVRKYNLAASPKITGMWNMLNEDETFGFLKSKDVLLLLTFWGHSNYQWKKDGLSIAGATSSSYTPSLPGTYHVEIMENGCAGSSSQLVVRMDKRPDTSYIGSIGDAEITLGRNEFIILAKDLSSGCDIMPDTVFTYEVESVCTDLPDDPSENSLIVFPLPVSDIHYFESSAIIRELIIIDIHGRIVHSSLPETANPEINLRDLTAGIYYYIVITDGNQITHGKIIVV